MSVGLQIDSPGRVDAGCADAVPDHRLALSVDSRGLFYRCNLPDTTTGRDMRVSLDRRDVSGSSIGFVAEKVTWTEQEDGPTIRLIEQAKLYDVSPVTYAAYRGCPPAES